MPYESYPSYKKNDFYEKMTKSVSNEPRLTKKAEVRPTSAPRPDLRTGVVSKTQNLPETDFFGKIALWVFFERLLIAFGWQKTLNKNKKN